MATGDRDTSLEVLLERAHTHTYALARVATYSDLNNYSRISKRDATRTHLAIITSRRVDLRTSNRPNDQPTDRTFNLVATGADEVARSEKK